MFHQDLNGYNQVHMRLSEDLDVNPDDDTKPYFEHIMTTNGKYAIVTTYFSGTCNVEFVDPCMLQYYKDKDLFFCEGYDEYVYDNYGANNSGDESFEENNDADVAIEKAKKTYDNFFFNTSLVTKNDNTTQKLGYTNSQCGIFAFEHVRITNMLNEREQLKKELAEKDAEIELLKGERDHALAYDAFGNQRIS